ncbi:hypothetical protein [Nonomuraea basaltis]|uniref:hypothetical protein n=1 Tax=Nonomuraea basaltis TaxID=2495887 RepID=UPI00110C66D6|nr:hypothetical protein [Nonomuraea basaltis]TMR89437.1 hypothetical protein EJK15_60780 [Nonomuraea basaltis]
MTAVPPLPLLDLDADWQATVQAWTRSAGRLHVHGDGVNADVRVERCAAGRLRDSYPVGSHDMELRVCGEPLAEILRTLADAVTKADPQCRRVVYAAPEGDLERVAAAESAGFRYVVDVDLADEQLSLLVAEPDRVTTTDMDLGHVPET